MTLGQLRSFLTVAETGSVRGAAERLVVTQPAVSAALAALQKEVGVALVARDGRGLRLTAAGEAFARYARQSLGLLDEAVAVAVDLARPERGRLRLAAVTTAGERVLPPLLAAFRQRYPEAQLDIEVGNRRVVWDLLLHHEVDLAIGGRPPAGSPLVSLATRPHRLVVVAARSDGAAARTRDVRWKDLASATWLLREPGSGTRGTTEELFHDLDLAPTVLTLGSNGAIREGVALGLGVTLISDEAVAPELEAGVLEEWRYGPLPMTRRWHVVGRLGGDLPPAAQLFLQHLVAPGADASAHGFRLVAPGSEGPHDEPDVTRAG